MRDTYILGITELLNQCEDLSLIELVYSLLAQEACQ